MKIKKKRVVDVVREISEPFCVENDMELLDVQFVKEGPYRYLRLLIDKDGGVSLDDCTLISKALNKRLDELDPIEENYFLEVSSAGVERELKQESDFEKFKGRMVQAKLFLAFDGEKLIEGTLGGLNGNIVSIIRDNESVSEIPRDKIAILKLVVNFEKED
ncbi:MAG: ribosome maturation factor RimP [Acidaminobacteraceae bacterium]